MGDGQRATPAPDGDSRPPVFANVDTSDGKGGQSMSDLLHEEDGIYFVRTKPLLLSDLLVLRRRVAKAGPHWIDRDTGVRVIEMAMRSLLAREAEPDADRKNSEVEGA